MGLKANKRILLIGGEGVVLYAATARGVERETSIAWEVPGFDGQLADALSAQHTAMAVFVLFDGADQAYRKEENIPRMSAFDRPKFVKRKLELAFPNYPIRASIEVKGGRGAPASYLFAALPDTEQLDRVGGALFDSGVPVGGFGLLPVESAGLVTELTQKLFSAQGRKAAPSRWAVLIGQHETGGLRQVVVKDGNLALARLTPTSEAGPSGAGWVEEVQRGFKETLAYISRFGYTPGDGLDVIVVCGDIEKQFFDPKAMPVTNFKCLNADEALKAIGVKSFGLAKMNFADAVHAAWAANKSALKLPVRVPSIHRIMAPRLAARVASAALVLTALGAGALGAQDYSDYLSVRDELAVKQNQQQMMQREYDEESKVFDALPVKPDIIKSILAVKATLDRNTVDPLPLLARLKTALGPDIALSSFSYTHTPGGGLPLGEAQPGAVLDPQDKGRLKFLFDFSLPDTLPLEQKVTRAESLQKSLEQAFPGWNVMIATQFGKVSRTGQFEGAAGDDRQAGAQNLHDSAQFSMEGPVP